MIDPAERLIHAILRGPLGAKEREILEDVLPGQIREQATQDCGRAIAAKGPAGHEGWYRPRGRPRVLYRYIFLPLEAALTDSGYIIGAYGSRQDGANRSAARCAAGEEAGACGAM